MARNKRWFTHSQKRDACRSAAILCRRQVSRIVQALHKLEDVSAVRVVSTEQVWGHVSPAVVLYQHPEKLPLGERRGAAGV
jgi:hypothetical protein